jgi:hypothetical protein
MDINIPISNSSALATVSEAIRLEKEALLDQIKALQIEVDKFVADVDADVEEELSKSNN